MRGLPGLKAIRQAKHLTLAQLATACGLDEATLSRYENGSRDPGLREAMRIAASLNVTINRLLNRRKEQRTA